MQLFSINFFAQVDAIPHEMHFNLTENLGKQKKISVTLWFHRKIHERQNLVTRKLPLSGLPKRGPRRAKCRFRIENRNAAFFNQFF